jgi:hypothetical protein
MAKSEAQLQGSPAAPEYPDRFSDLLVLLKFLCTIGLLYFLNAIIFLTSPTTMMTKAHSPLVKITAILITIPRTFYTIRNLLSTWTIISYIVGHIVVTAHPTRNLRWYEDLQIVWM